ncbi:response regulator, partial [Elusimicrobiota bacterium]
MPVMDGFEVMKMLKGKKETAGIPVIVYSSAMNSRNRKKCKSLGAAECLDKSTPDNILVSKIKKSIKDKRKANGRDKNTDS